MSTLYRLYQNKLIPKGRYFVKVVGLHQGPALRRPFIEVVLRVSDIHGTYGGTELYVPIHSTPEADPVYTGFLGSFELYGGGLTKAVGRYARVAIKHCKYKTTAYAGVRFVPQRECDYADAPAARKRDEEVAARKETEAKKKAELKAKKQAEKEAYEALFGPRGRGRPRLTPTMPGVDLFA